MVFFFPNSKIPRVAYVMASVHRVFLEFQIM